MIFILFLRNTLIFLNNFISLLQIITTKSLKKFFIFTLFYIFFNLFIIPTFAFCEIDYDLLDRENNKYNGSKILYEDTKNIVTKKDLNNALGICDTIIIVSIVTIIIIFPIYIYSEIN